MGTRKVKFRRKGVPWKLAELKHLGKTPDSVLARRRKRTVKEVVAMRESRRVGLSTPPRRWTAREIRLLGTMSDLETATAAEDALLGTERDKIIAGRIGRHHSVVTERRDKLGIPRSGIRTPRANTWQAEHVAVLGTASDEEIARRIGRSVDAVKLRRRKMGIPAYLLTEHFTGRQTGHNFPVSQNQ